MDYQPQTSPVGSPSFAGVVHGNPAPGGVQVATVGAFRSAGVVHGNPAPGGVQVATVGAFRSAQKWDGVSRPSHEPQTPVAGPFAASRLAFRVLRAAELKLGSAVPVIPYVRPYIANVEPTDRIDRYDPILFNVVDPSRTITTRDLSEVTVMVYHGGAWEVALFRGQFVEPYLNNSFAIQAPAGGVAKLHFQVARSGGWRSLEVSLRVSAWGWEALPV